MDGTAPGHPEGPYLLNLASEPWEEHLDRAPNWLGNVVTTQAAFRQAVEIAVPKVEQPDIRQFLSEMLDRAGRQEEVAHRLPRVLGRGAADGARGLARAAMDVGRKALDTVEGLAGGAKGNWKDLHHLLLLNRDAMGPLPSPSSWGSRWGPTSCSTSPGRWRPRGLRTSSSSRS